MKRSLGAEVWIRRILGIAVLAGVAAVAFGLDRGMLTRLSLASTSNLEQRLLSTLPTPDPTKRPVDAARQQTRQMMMSAGGSTLTA